MPRGAVALWTAPSPGLALAITGLGDYHGEDLDRAGLARLFPDLTVGERKVGADWTLLVASRDGREAFYVDGATVHLRDPDIATPWPGIHVGATYDALVGAVGPVTCRGAEAMAGGIVCQGRDGRFAFYFAGAGRSASSSAKRRRASC